MNIQKLDLIILFLTCALCIASVCATRTVDTHLNSNDIGRLRKVFTDGLNSNDMQSIYYSSLNVETTNPADKVALCKNILDLYIGTKLNLYEAEFYLIGVHKKLQCKEELHEKILANVYSAFDNEIATTQEIYYRVATHKILGVPIKEEIKQKILKRLQELLRKDDTLVSLGQAFNMAAELGPDAAFIAERVEDALVQADEVDGIMLQFEGGLSITGLIINGVIRISEHFNKPAPLTDEQAVKFANYFLSRRSVQTAKGAHLLIESLKTLSKTKNVAPICVQLIGNGQLQAESPTLNVVVVDLLGKPIKPELKSIKAKIVQKDTSAVLVENVQLVSKSSDKTTYAVDLTANKPKRGIYLAELNIDDVYKQTLPFKVLGRVKVESLELGVAEADASSSTKKQTVVYPKKLQNVLKADSTQKLLMKVVLLDEDSKKAITVHQAFVRVYNPKSDQEIIFVAEQDSSKAYKFDMDVDAHGSSFDYESGLYQISLIVGDASISNSFEWHVADVLLKFPSDRASKPKVQIRSALPEIVHQFRAPEKRPPRIVSDVFTGLCLTPLVLLFIFWNKLGINVSNFTLAPSTLGFHLGFGGILTLFTVFWWKLNMFQTLRLLIPIAIFTFLCGNRLLRRLYALRVSKSNAT